MKRYVLDASILIKLFFQEEHSTTCVRAVRDAAELLAPELLWAETANVVWKRLRRGEITATDAGALIDEMLRVPIVIHTHSSLVSPALALAAETGRTVYDCLYLALAVRENVPMLTADERLANSLASGAHGKHVRFVGTQR